MREIPLDLRLEGDGLLLRLPTDADVEAITAACRDPEIARWTTVPSPYREDDARWFVEQAAAAAREGTGANLVVLEGGRLVASCGLPRLSPLDLAGEIGYWVAPWARHRGVATRAAAVVVRWAFDGLGLERLTLEAAVPNVGSNAVARRLGFTLEGTLRRGAILGHTGEPGAERVDLNVYGLLPGEFSRRP